MLVEDLFRHFSFVTVVTPRPSIGRSVVVVICLC